MEQKQEIWWQKNDSQLRHAIHNGTVRPMDLGKIEDKNSIAIVFVLANWPCRSADRLNTI